MCFVLLLIMICLLHAFYAFVLFFIFPNKLQFMEKTIEISFQTLFGIKKNEIHLIALTYPHQPRY